MFIMRLFRRQHPRGRSQEDQVEVASRTRHTISPDSWDHRPPETDPHSTITRIIARSRPRIRPLDRVGAAVRLVDALRRLDDHQRRSEEGLEGAPHGQHLFIAMALRELDQLVDSMSYEELWDAFGGQVCSGGLSEEDIKLIPSREVRKEAVCEEATCAVCLGEFSRDHVVRDLPVCCHTFHAECIDKWLLRKANCPICRERVIISITPTGNAL